MNTLANDTASVESDGYASVANYSSRETSDEDRAGLVAYTRRVAGADHESIGNDTISATEEGRESWYWEASRSTPDRGSSDRAGCVASRGSATGTTVQRCLSDRSRLAALIASTAATTSTTMTGRCESDTLSSSTGAEDEATTGEASIEVHVLVWTSGTAAVDIAVT